MNTLVLTGCRDQPLASYLKGLGVFRLLAMQADAGITSRWGDAGLELQTKLNRDELIMFFLERYAPTPVIAPWNGGSGFYPKDNKTGIDALKSSTGPRFESYRTALMQAERVVSKAGSEKGSAKSDEDERRKKILVECRNTLPEICIDWLDAAIAISSDGSRAFAPVLGTGGNEGRLDYTNNFMSNIASLLIPTSGKKASKVPVRELLENALFDTPTTGLQDIPVGQYDPGRTGGFNQGQGIESGSLANPWTAVLTIEGAIVWAGGIYRKQGVSYRSFLCSPFTVKPSAAGYGSAAKKDETAARAELWAPLWQCFGDFGEIRSLFREGRAAINGKPAQNGLEFAEAVASLGVDRGISSFVRYSLLKRRGDSYIAPPLGRFAVRWNRRADLLKQIEPIIDGLEQSLSRENLPSSWLSLRRQVEESILNALSLDREDTFESVAAAYGAAIRWLCLAKVDVSESRTRLKQEWITECLSAESDIAASLASLPDLLTNLSTVSNLHSWTGRDLADKMVNTLNRRVRSGQSLRGRAVVLESLRRFLDGELDEQRIENLTFAFAGANQPERKGMARPSSGKDLWPVYCAMKLLFLSVDVRDRDREISLAPDLAIPSLLFAGRTEEACAIAIRRLRIAGLRPLEVAYGNAVDARRLGAALLIPYDGYSTLLRAVAAEEEAN